MSAFLKFPSVWETAKIGPKHRPPISKCWICGSFGMEPFCPKCGEKDNGFISAYDHTKDTTQEEEIPPGDEQWDGYSEQVAKAFKVTEK